MNKTIIGLIMIFISSISLAYAERKLGADEIKALFSGVTFEGYNELKEKQFKVFSKKGGKHILVKPNGKKKKMKWFVDEYGRHCVRKRKLKCAEVFDMGDGEYHKRMNGVHTHTLTNFRKGKHI